VISFTPRSSYLGERYRDAHTTRMINLGQVTPSLTGTPESLERGPLSLVSTIEELLGRKSSASGLERREYGRKDPSR
jgi:hypothetical protein